MSLIASLFTQSVLFKSTWIMSGLSHLYSCKSSRATDHKYNTIYQNKTKNTVCWNKESTENYLANIRFSWFINVRFIYLSFVGQNIWRSFLGFWEIKKKNKLWDENILFSEVTFSCVKPSNLLNLVALHLRFITNMVFQVTFQLLKNSWPSNPQLTALVKLRESSAIGEVSREDLKLVSSSAAAGPSTSSLMKLLYTTASTPTTSAFMIVISTWRLSHLGIWAVRRLTEA